MSWILSKKYIKDRDKFLASVHELDQLYVGLLTEEERKLFEYCLEEGLVQEYCVGFSKFPKIMVLI